jgi:hypothetical protein
MRITGFVLADEDVSAPGPSVETGAGVPCQREVDSLPDEGSPLFYGPQREEGGEKSRGNRGRVTGDLLMRFLLPSEWGDWHDG